MPDRSVMAYHPVGMRVGPWCLFGGLFLLVLIGIDRGPGLSVRMPPSWYSNLPLWTALGFALLGLGIALQWPRRSPTRTVRPLFQSVRLYSRPGCHLCEAALVELLAHADLLPPVEEIDVSRNAELEAKFGQVIPVVEFDGKVRFRGRMSRVLLRRLIEGVQRSRELSASNGHPAGAGET